MAEGDSIKTKEAGGDQPAALHQSEAPDHRPYKGLKRLEIFPSYFQIFSIKFCQKLTDGDESFSITEVVQALGTLEFC